MLTVIANTFNSYNKKLCYCTKTKQCPTVDKIWQTRCSCMKNSILKCL